MSRRRKIFSSQTFTLYVLSAHFYYLIVLKSFGLELLGKIGMKILNIIQIVIAVLLVAVVLLQSQGGGLSQFLGGGGGGGGEAWRTRRGFERFLFISTIVLAILFLGVALVSLFV